MPRAVTSDPNGGHGRDRARFHGKETAWAGSDENGNERVRSQAIIRLGRRGNIGHRSSAEPGHNVIAAIRQTWLEHGVIFFREQDLPPAKFLRFAKRFGDVVEYPFIKGIEGFPEIIPVVKLEHETKNFGGIWHTDTAYLETPPMATMLIAREVPPFGGDTLFANMYLAYETLSDGMKRMLDGLIAVNHRPRPT